MEEKNDTQQQAAQSVFRPISTAEAKARLAQNIHLNVDEKDPVMALVELHTAFCEDQMLLLERHEKAVTKAMSGVVGELHQKMREETQAFSQAVSLLASDNTKDILGNVKKTLDEHQRFLFLTVMANVSVSALMFGIALCVLVLRLR